MTDPAEAEVAVLFFLFFLFPWVLVLCFYILLVISREIPGRFLADSWQTPGRLLADDRSAKDSGQGVENGIGYEQGQGGRRGLDGRNSSGRNSKCWGRGGKTTEVKEKSQRFAASA